MRERFLGWLESKANAYLIWMYEREERGSLICPDCDCPVVHCWCDERDRQDELAREAYEAGIDEGVERAMTRGDRW